MDNRPFLLCKIVPVLPPALRLASDKLFNSLQKITQKDIEQGIGAPMSALQVAKEMAPLGIPDYSKIIAEGTFLSVWGKVHGKASTAKFILLFIISLNKYFNVVRPMSREQMEELAIEFADYHMYTFEDFIAFFEGIKRQRFGEIRDRLDPATMWEMFRKYDVQRDLFFEKRARAYQEYPDKDTPSTNQLAIRGSDKIIGAFNHIKNNIQNERNK